MENEPSVIFSGNMRSGTTSLYEYLDQHPQVYTGERKESRFFEEDKNFKKGKSHYLKIFENHDGEEVIASFVGRPYKKEVPKRISKTLDIDKILFILRDPVTWVHSMYFFGINKGIFNTSKVNFSEFIKSEDHKWSEKILEHGKHIEYITNFEKIFGKDRIMCTVLEELSNNHYKEVERVYKFVGINKDFSPEKRVSNKTKNVKYPSVYRSLYQLWDPLEDLFPTEPFPALKSRVRSLFFDEDVEREEMKPSDREYLRSFYAESNRRLEEWLGREIQHWT